MAETEEELVGYGEARLKLMLNSCSDLNRRLCIRRALRKLTRAETPQPVAHDDHQSDSKVKRVFSQYEDRRVRRSSLHTPLPEIANGAEKIETDAVDEERVPDANGNTVLSDGETDRPSLGTEAISKMFDTVELSKLLRESRDFEERRAIRARIRDLKAVDIHEQGKDSPATNGIHDEVTTERRLLEPTYNDSPNYFPSLENSISQSNPSVVASEQVLPQTQLNESQTESKSKVKNRTKSERKNEDDESEERRRKHKRKDKEEDEEGEKKMRRQKDKDENGERKHKKEKKEKKERKEEDYKQKKRKKEKDKDRDKERDLEREERREERRRLRKLKESQSVDYDQSVILDKQSKKREKSLEGTSGRSSFNRQRSDENLPHSSTEKFDDDDTYEDVFSSETIKTSLQKITQDHETMNEQSEAREATVKSTTQDRNSLSTDAEASAGVTYTSVFSFPQNDSLHSLTTEPNVVSYVLTKQHSSQHYLPDSVISKSGSADSANKIPLTTEIPDPEFGCVEETSSVTVHNTSKSGVIRRRSSARLRSLSSDPDSDITVSKVTKENHSVKPKSSSGSLKDTLLDSEISTYSDDKNQNLNLAFELDTKQDYNISLEQLQSTEKSPDQANSYHTTENSLENEHISENGPNRNVSNEKSLERSKSSEETGERKGSLEKLQDEDIPSEKSQERELTFEGPTQRKVSHDNSSSRKISADEIPERKISTDKMPEKKISSENTESVKRKLSDFLDSLKGKPSDKPISDHSGGVKSKSTEHSDTIKSKLSTLTAPFSPKTSKKSKHSADSAEAAGNSGHTLDARAAKSKTEKSESFKSKLAVFTTKLTPKVDLSKTKIKEMMNTDQSMATEELSKTIELGDEDNEESVDIDSTVSVDETSLVRTAIGDELQTVSAPEILIEADMQSGLPTASIDLDEENETDENQNIQTNLDKNQTSVSTKVEKNDKEQAPKPATIPLPTATAGTEYEEEGPRRLHSTASAETNPRRLLTKANSTASIMTNRLFVPGQQPIRRERLAGRKKAVDLVNMENLSKMIESAEEQDRRREIRAATRAVKNEIKTGGWAVAGNKLVGKKSGIIIKPEQDGSVEICHIQGHGEEQQKILLNVAVSKNGDDEEVYDLTSKIIKTRYLGEGDELEEMDEIKTRRRLTSRGSVYMTKDSKMARTLRNLVGHEFVDEEITKEIKEESVSRQETKHDRVISRTMLQSVGALESDHELSDVEDGDDDVIDEPPPPEPKKLLPRAGSFRKDSVSLDVIVKPENVSVNKGETAQLRFTVSCSHPSPEIVWYLDDEEVIESADISMAYNKGEVNLQIKHVTSEDVGKYTCSIKAGTSEIQVTASLLIEDASDHDEQIPDIIHGLLDVTVKENNSVTLECNFNDAPDVTVKWYKGKKLIKNDQDFKQVVKRNLAQLIMEAVYPEDEGTYTCEVSNENGKDESKCRVTVRTDESNQDAVIPIEPQFVQPLTNQTRKDQERVVFSCELIGEPKPTVTWYKDGNLLPNSDEFYQTYDGLTAKLTIAESFGDDTGSFKCVAENKAGRATSRANLIIVGREDDDGLVKFDERPHGTAIRRTASAPNRPQAKSKKTMRRITEERDVDVVIKPVPTSPIRINIEEPPTSPKPYGNFIHDESGAFSSVTVQEKGVDPLVQSTLERKEELDSLPQNLLENVKDIALPTCAATQEKPVTASKETIILEQVTNVTTSAPPSPGAQKRRFNSLTSEPDEETNDKDNTIKSKDPIVTKSRRIIRRSSKGIIISTEKAKEAETIIVKDTQLEREIAPEFLTNLPQNKDGQSGQPLTLSCTLTGYPPPTVEWYKNENLLLNDDKYQQSYDNQTAKLVIRRLYADDEGCYRCQCRNTHGEAVSSCDVKVYGDSSSRRASCIQPSSSSSSEGLTKDILEKLEKVHNLTMTTQNEESAEVAGTEYDFETNGSGKRLHTKPPIHRSKSVDVANVKTLFENGNMEQTPFLRPAERLESFHASTGTPKNSERNSPLSILPEKPVNNIDKKSDVLKSKENLMDKQEDLKPEPVKIKRVNSKVGSMINLFQQGNAPVERSQSMKEGLRRQTSWKRDGSGGWLKNGQEANTSAPAKVVKVNNKMDVQSITDEAQLQQMLNATEDFDERKKIRDRIRNLRDKHREEMEEARLKREEARGDSVQAKMMIAAEGKQDMINRYKDLSVDPNSVRESQRFTEDHVKDIHRQAEEQKQKKLEHLANQGSTADRLVSTHSDNLVKLRQMEAEQAKQRKLRAFGDIAKSESRTKTETIETGDGVTHTKSVTTTQKGAGGSTTTRTQKTTSTVGGFGTSYGTPAETTARQLADRLKLGGSTTAGQVTVKTESWSSKDGVVKRDEKTQSWGAKPTGAKGAMAAFKQADAAANPGGTKPNPLQYLPLSNIKRNASTIKQGILAFAQRMTQSYENVNVTNFSSSWNDGMAFCALIHHFHPEAFKFEELDPKRRRYNFTLAFDTAEKYADIAPLLDVEDMVKMKNPDWKCVFTYVQSFYRKFRDHECEIHKRPTPQSPQTPETPQ